MISRQTRLQLVVFGLIALLGMAYTGIHYAGLGQYFSSSGYTVSADFPDSGGIFSGAQVTYRGVPVGQVGPLTLRPDGVRVALKLDNGVRVPSSVKALVANRSAIGEQYVDLQPQRDGAPYLQAGTVIPRSASAIPIQPTELLVNLDRLVNSVGTRDVGVVLDELGAAFDGTGPDLQRLVDAGDQLTRTATDALPQTVRLIRDGNTVLDTQRDTAAQFRSFNRDLRALTAQLRASDPDFRRLFANGARSAAELQDLFASNRAALPVLLDNLESTAQVQQVRLPGLRQILVTYPNVVAGGYTVTPGDGTAHFGLVTTQDPPPCTRGYESTAKRDPAATSNPTPNLRAYCADTGPGAVRGARNAPYPPDSRPFPENGGSATSSGAALRGGAAPAPAADPVTLGDYDPATGRVITSEGRTLSIGSTAGADTVFGARSWEWLLLGPLSGR